LAHLAGADSSRGAQAVPAVQDWCASAAAAPAAFEWSDASGVLFAAGGAAPAAIHCWDLAQERCLAQARAAAACCSISHRSPESRDRAESMSGQYRCNCGAGVLTKMASGSAGGT